MLTILKEVTTEESLMGFFTPLRSVQNDKHRGERPPYAIFVKTRMSKVSPLAFLSFIPRECK